MNCGDLISMITYDNLLPMPYVSPFSLSLLLAVPLPIACQIVAQVVPFTYWMKFHAVTRQIESWCNSVNVCLQLVFSDLFDLHFYQSLHTYEPEFVSHLHEPLQKFSACLSMEALQGNTFLATEKILWNGDIETTFPSRSSFCKPGKFASQFSLLLKCLLVYWGSSTGKNTEKHMYLVLDVFLQKK